MIVEKRVFRIAPLLSKSDAALLIASLCEGDRSSDAYHFWRRQLNWDDVPDRWHRLLPLLYDNIVRFGEHDPFVDRIKGVRRYMWVKNLKLIGLAKKVLGEFVREGIDVIPLKGTSLLATGFVDRSTRPMNDIDILVRPEQMARAIALLSNLGIQPRFIRPESVINRLLPERSLSGWPFMTHDGLEVDVHWSAMHLDRRDKSDTNIWIHAQTITFEGIPIRVLDAADQLITVCAHGVRDSEPGSLRWITDAALIVKKAGNIDWTRVVERAKHHELSAVLARALDLLQALLNLAIPNEVIRRLHRQSGLYERLEIKALNRPPHQWKKGLAGRYLKLQEFRRGREDVFGASFGQLLTRFLIEDAGTLGIWSALSRRIFFWLNGPPLLRRWLASDRHLQINQPRALPLLSDLGNDFGWTNEAIFLHGWSIAELSGRWTDGPCATIAMRLQHSARKLPTLKFDLAPAVNIAHPELTLFVYYNDHLVAERRYVHTAVDHAPVICSGPTLTEPASLLVVTFEIKKPWQPGARTGGAPDFRRLGLFLSKISRS